MKKTAFFLSALLLLVFIGCSDDDNSSAPANAIAFANPAINLVSGNNTISIAFASAAAESGTITLNVTPNGVAYGTDFNTTPAVTGTTLTVPFTEGATSATFTFNSLITITEGQVKNVVFTIVSTTLEGATILDETKTTQLNFNETPITNNPAAVPAIGGANVPNQVYFDLSSGIGTSVNRTSWDLGFHAGTEFRVAINGSLKMAAKQLDITDMTQVVAIDNTVAVGEGGGSGVINGNIAYVDGPNGDINGTVIGVSANDADNKVYLVNLGYDHATAAPAPGSVNPYGEARGWKKIRVLKSGNDYKFQYANVDATTFQEVTITKNEAYNFTFFSFNTNGVVMAEPEKAKWDINLTPFTNHTNFGAGFVSYPFQDFIVSNRKGGTRIYQVLNSAGVLYNDFTAANVNADNFNTDGAIDQRAIGSNWRNGGGPGTLPSVKDDRFYIVKDKAGNIYKLRFISMTSTAGERGNVTFEYKLL